MNEFENCGKLSLVHLITVCEYRLCTWQDRKRGKGRNLLFFLSYFLSLRRAWSQAKPITKIYMYGPALTTKLFNGWLVEMLMILFNSTHKCLLLTLPNILFIGSSESQLTKNPS